jgi:hypothetical protein
LNGGNQLSKFTPVEAYRVSPVAWLHVSVGQDGAIGHAEALLQVENQVSQCCDRLVPRACQLDENKTQSQMPLSWRQMVR